MKIMIRRLREFSFPTTFVLSLLASLLPAAGAQAAGTVAGLAEKPAANAAFLLTLVERDLARAPIEGEALAAVYRQQVRSLEDAATFFHSASFLRLDLGGQRQVIAVALERDPVGFLGQAEFLPVALREQYRQKARQAAQENVLRRLAPLTLLDEVKLYLPSREGMRDTAAGSAAFDRDGQVRRFLRDRSLRSLGQLENAWIAAAAGPFASAEALVEAKVLTARNLDRAGLAPSEQNVLRVWRELEAARGTLAGLQLFAGRQVVFAAGQDGRGEGPTFGKPSTLAAIAAQAPASLELLRSGAGASAGLARAIAAAGPLTLVLESHGRADAIQFAGKLGAAELAAMFAARRSAEPAIVIVNACFGHDFARAFADQLTRLGVELPVLIVPEEFGQATVIGRQESTFTRDELGLGRSEATRLGQLWAGLHRETAVYAPLAFGLAQLR